MADWNLRDLDEGALYDHLRGVFDQAQVDHADLIQEDITRNGGSHAEFAFREGTNEINLIGARGFLWDTLEPCESTNTAWDDTMFAVYKDAAGAKKVEKYRLNTEKNATDAISHLPEGVFRYKLGFHHNDDNRRALKPYLTVPTVYDDDNDFAQSEGDSLSALQWLASINIHNGGTNSSPTGWSAGCQTMWGSEPGETGSGEGFPTFVRTCERDKTIQGSNENKYELPAGNGTRAVIYALVKGWDLDPDLEHQSPVGDDDESTPGDATDGTPPGVGIEGDLCYPLNRAIPELDAARALYQHTEKDHVGGYFPVGTNTVWHGGVHLRGEQGDPVYACAKGEVIAVRMPRDPAKGYGYYGSRNFVLMRHTSDEFTWYSLYMHLDSLPADEDPAWIDASSVSGQGLPGLEYDASGEYVTGGDPNAKVADNFSLWEFDTGSGYRVSVRLVAELQTLRERAGRAVNVRSVDASGDRCRLASDADIVSLATTRAGEADSVVEASAEGSEVWVSLDPSQAVSLTDETLEKLLDGGVIGLTVPLQAGDLIGWMGTFGEDDEQHPQLHWEIFSDRNVPNLFSAPADDSDSDTDDDDDDTNPDADTDPDADDSDSDSDPSDSDSDSTDPDPDRDSDSDPDRDVDAEPRPGVWTTVMDRDEDFNMDVSAITSLIDQDDALWYQDQEEQDEILTGEELTRFFQTNPDAKKVRRYSCYFVSEWGMDLSVVIPAMLNLGIWDTYLLEDRIKPYLWWNEALAENVPLPLSRHTWHFNPIAFVEDLYASRVGVGVEKLEFAEDALDYRTPGVGAWVKATHGSGDILKEHLFAYTCPEVGLIDSTTDLPLASMDTYYSNLDALYQQRDQGDWPRTELQKELLAQARRAAKDPGFWEKVRNYDSRSLEAKIDWSLEAKIVSPDDDDIKLDAILQHRWVKQHVFLVACGLMKTTSVKVRSATALRSFVDAHKFCTEYRILTSVDKDEIFENFKEMYVDDAHLDGDDIQDLDGQTWAKKEHFVNAEGEVVTDMDLVDQDLTWANIHAYVDTLTFRNGSNRYDPAAEGYTKTSDNRLPNSTRGNQSNHVHGFAYDYSYYRHDPTNVLLKDDPIHDFVAWEFGVLRCVKEQWHFSRTARPADGVEATLTVARQAVFPE
jgi:hypothetical protein